MVTDQNHSSDISSEQEVSRRTEKLAQTFGLDKQNAEVYSALSDENRALKKQLEDYHSEYISLKRMVKRLERDIKSLETELDECVDRETVIDLIQEIVPLIISKKLPKKGEVNLATVDFYESSSSEENGESNV
jgi:translation initiation factor 2B subunit (eIF-2B alpha/beta/delta family)